MGPILTPLAGADKEYLSRTLRELATRAANIRSSGSVDPLRDYIRWANDAAHLLRTQLRSEEIDRLILTRRYWVLQSLGAQVTPPVTMLLNTELAERHSELEEAVRLLDRQLKHWQRPGKFVVADTSFYIRHHQKLEDVDFGFLDVHPRFPFT